MNNSTFFHDRLDSLYDLNTDATGTPAKRRDGSNPASRKTTRQIATSIGIVSKEMSDSREALSSSSTISRKASINRAETPRDMSRLRNVSENIMSEIFQPDAP